MASSERRRRGPAMLPRDTDIREFLLGLSPEDREEAMCLLGPEDADGLDRAWSVWAHKGQSVPATSAGGIDWSTCVIMGGRGFGKTRAGSEWIVSLLRESEDGRCGRRFRKPLFIALVGATIDDARKVMILGPSGLMRVAGPWIREWRRKDGTLIFCTGAEAQLFSGHTPEMLRGPEHDYAWCDELAKWEKPQETWDMLQLGLRRGERPRVLVTTTPRPGPVLKGIMALPGSVTIGGPTHANPHNSEAWRRDMDARYAGTRLARQELDGQLLPDTPGALWTVELLERCRAGDSHFHARSEDWMHGGAKSDGPHFHRIVIAVDPPSGGGTCGIIACAKDKEGRAHVLADHSVTALSPEGWARAVADAAAMWGHLSTSVPVEPAAPPPSVPPETSEPRIWVMCPRAGRYVLQPKPRDPPRNGEGDHAQHGGGGPAPRAVPVLVVAEQNQGGKMVAAVLRIADPGLRVKLVTATQGKTDRAAPVAMLFEAGKVTLHGRFPELEAELLGMIAGGDYEGPGASPDRADAMVWALTELMLQKEARVPRIRSL